MDVNQAIVEERPTSVGTQALLSDSRRDVTLAVLVAALGYFVDIYDLILFSIVRVPSLLSLGVAPADLLSRGVLLLNLQMGGMLIGGILWGVLGDKRGRRSVLFGSIALYSIANIANGLVGSMGSYALWRFLAGVGLAGELGAGVTLVSEIMTPKNRGYGTTAIATAGMLGAIVAVLIGDTFSWRVAYVVGGGMGIVLLLLRIGIFESSMFEDAKQHSARRGDFLSLFANRRRALKYLSVIAIGVPIWYVMGILITFSPEFGQERHMSVLPNAGRAIMFAYAGLVVGGFYSGWLSQRSRSRKRVVRLFTVLTGLGIAAFFGVRVDA